MGFGAWEGLGSGDSRVCRCRGAREKGVGVPGWWTGGQQAAVEEARVGEQGEREEGRV
jgi:hypothetical protein